MNKKMFMLESLKLEKTLFEMNGPFGIISSIFNLYSKITIEKETIQKF